MLKIFIVLCSVILIVNSLPMPQNIDELQTKAILVVAQMKDMYDKGAAAQSENDFEILGVGMHKDIGMGFGEAIKRNRRATHSHSNKNSENSSSGSSSESSSSESEE